MSGSSRFYQTPYRACLLLGLLVRWLGLAWSSHAQVPLPPGVRYFSLTDGLPHRQVNCLLQDRAGLLWVGTVRGLARFDGEKFERVGDSATAPGLLSGPVNALAEEPGRALWAGTPTGLRRLDLRTGRETRVRADPAGHQPSHERIHAVVYTAKGQLYVGTNAGWLLRRVDSTTFERVVRLPLSGPRPAWIWGLDEDAAGNIWIGTQHHRAAFRYNPHTGRLHSYEAPSRQPQSATLALTRDRRTVYINLTADGLFRYDAATDRLVVLAPGRPDTRRQREILVDTRQRLWYGWLTGSLERYDPVTQQTADLTADMPFIGNLQSLLLDRIGTVWIGTQNGLFHFREPPQSFDRLLSQPPDSAVGHRYSMRGLLELPDGQLLVASYRGMLRLDPVRGTIVRQYPARDPTGRPLKVNGFALLAAPDSAGRGAWVLTEGNGLQWLDLTSGRYRPAEAQPGPQPRYGRSLAHDARGHVWVASYEGVYDFDPATRTMRRFVDPAYPAAHYLHGYALVAHGGDLWVGADEGLFQLDPVTGRVRRHFPTVGEGVRVLWFDSAGDAWVGTATGLCQLNIRTGRVRRLTKAQGLVDNVIDGLLPGAGHQLWISTDNGLSVLDRRTLRCINFFLPDGLSDNEFNISSALRTRAGELWFGSVNGLTRCRPRLTPTQPAGTVELTSLTWFDGATVQTRERRFGLAPTAGRLPELTLQPDDLFFGASFVLTDFDYPTQHRYAYRLAGFDRDWSPPWDPLESTCRHASLSIL